ncbi:MAG TPA: hypothetical protein VES20_16700, partial [Bryobacteraceae bacterium]|nr:hypothetical protein [Bryobacteraceae bacterium]
KLDGVPVLQVIRMGGTASGMPSETEMAAQQGSAPSQGHEQAPPDAGAAAGAAGAAAGGRLGGKIGGLAGGLGGLGGFGRKKKQQDQEAQAAPQHAQQQTLPPAAPQSGSASASSGRTPPGTLMELTSELSSFSSAPVDSARLDVPAGFKQIEHDMSKSLR